MLFKVKNQMLKTLSISLTLTLGACATPVQNVSTIHAATSIQNDRRSLGTILDDGTLYLALYNAISQDKNNILKDAHLNFLTYESKVLVTGEVAKAQHKALIEHLIIEHVPQVLKIINEVQVAPASSLLSRANDSLITVKVKALFYNQEVFHPARVKVSTENKTVYLMGKVTKREAKEAVRTTKKVSGVKKIVKIFEYLKSRPISEIKAQQRRELEAKTKIEIDKQKQALERQKALIRAQELKIQQQIDQLSDTESSGTRF